MGINFQRGKNLILHTQLIKQDIGKDDVIPKCIPAPARESSRVEGSLETYTSKRLKLSFSYFQSTNSPHKLEVEEEGNKISIFVVGSSGEKWVPKFVQVFDKNPEKSLSEAVSENFLNSYSPDNCGIKEDELEKKYKMYNPDFEYATIRVLGIASDTSYEESRAKAALCPEDYISFNGIRYFVMDKKHPGRYAFVDIGQDNISAYPNMSWDMTIRFLD